MINLLILYYLDQKVLTMYGISKNIKKDFAVFTLPSIGTIKPALNRLIASGFISTQKFMSKGGRPSVYYAITQAGRIALKGFMLEPLPENPIQFLTTARIRLYCANVLEPKDLSVMLKMLKDKASVIMAETAILQEGKSNDFYPKMVLDNLNCEYKNFISLLEGVERACKH